VSGDAAAQPADPAPGGAGERADVDADDLRDPRTAAWLGAALGVAFGVCFATGVWSHLAQNPPAWYPPRPAGLYRITQGVHVVTGTASIPLLVAKLWVVHRHLFARPPVRSALHAVERLALLPLVGGAVFQLVSGTANVARWYPWSFFFPKAHYWVAWITIGALVVHVGAKAATTRDAFRRRPRPATWPAAIHEGDAPPDVAPPRVGVAASSTDRRAFLAGVALASGALVVASAGGTVAPLSGLSVLAQRRPGFGPQGLPVNKTAVGADVVEIARDPAYRLEIAGAVRRPLSLTRADLVARPQRHATLPIACVEGWSASAEWGGVPVRELLALAGAREDAEVTVESLQPSGLYRASVLTARQAADPDTLLALTLRGEALHIDHGYPVRLVGPNRPGVAQTKWVHRLVVHR
jgi:Oxidoreductase molybdopterin binding domain